MPHPDSIKSGFQVFTCGPTDEEAHFAYSSEVGLIMSGTAGASLADVREITKLEVALPTEVGIVDHMLRLECKSRVWTGRNSVLSMWTNQFNKHLHVGRSLWQAWSPPKSAVVNHAGKGILLGKWVANRVSSFLQAQAISPAALNARLPNPSYIIDSILEESDWSPNLSPAFMSKYNIQHFCGMLTRPPVMPPAAPALPAAPRGSGAPGPAPAPAPSPA